MSFMTTSLDPFFLPSANVNQRELLAQYHDAFQNYLWNLSVRQKRKKENKTFVLKRRQTRRCDLDAFLSFFPRSRVHR